MRYVGYSEYFHDAALSIIDEEGNIEYASQAERYSKIKNDNMVHYQQASKIKPGDNIYFYENPVIRERNHITNAGKMFRYKDQRRSVMPVKSPFETAFIDHHVSHGAAGLMTRPWDNIDDTVILTVDGAGENDTACIFDSQFKKIRKWCVPQSVGFVYAHATDFLGFKPLEEEYTVMGLSSYGEDKFSDEMCEYFYDTELLSNGVMPKLVDFLKEKNIYQDKVDFQTKADVAASVQKFAEKIVIQKAKIARKFGSKLIYSGGVAQNILINNKLKEMFDDVWIFPSPTDSGSSLGVASYFYHKETGNNKINWQDTYLGDEMGKINPKEVVDYLLKNKVCGVASGRAEFGPRALGNRSLIADVRFDLKDTVNSIKKRQKFRPFAPAILEEFASDYFDGPMNEYMQYSSIAKHDYKSVTHVDGTARVQIVKPNCRSQIRQILEEYYEKTGVPMLLNTSLNVRGKPIVNNKYDCFLFEKINNTKVFYNDID